MIKKTNKLAAKFTLRNGSLYFLSNVDGSIYYPRSAERQKIIAEHHNLGHFQALATYKKIKTNFYWSGMVSDILKFVKRCKSLKFRFRQ